jgi:hypothetical protein
LSLPTGQRFRLASHHVAYRLENKRGGKNGPVLATHYIIRRFDFADFREERNVMEDATRGEYDLYSAVTFFLVGVGVGSVLALLFNPRQRATLESIHSWRKAA